MNLRELACSKHNGIHYACTQVSMIQTLCYLLETLLTPETTPPDTAKDIYELYFVFAAIWSFGGFLFKDEVTKAHTHMRARTYVHTHTLAHIHSPSLLTIVWSSLNGG